MDNWLKSQNLSFWSKPPGNHSGLTKGLPDDTRSGQHSFNETLDWVLLKSWFKGWMYIMISHRRWSLSLAYLCFLLLWKSSGATVTWPCRHAVSRTGVLQMVFVFIGQPTGLCLAMGWAIREPIIWVWVCVQSTAWMWLWHGTIGQNVM